MGRLAARRRGAHPARSGVGLTPSLLWVAAAWATNPPEAPSAEKDAQATIPVDLNVEPLVSRPYVARAPGMRWFRANPEVPVPDLSGAFDAPPVYQFRARLPGPPLNTTTHAEWSDPVVVGDHVLVGSAAAHALFALSRRDGRVERIYEADESVEASPSVVGERVYFADTGGNTYCYTIDGRRLWKHNGNAPILVAPTVSEDGTRVFVTNVDDLAVALVAATGELEWQYRAKRDLTRETELSLYAAPRALVHDDEVILGFSNGTLVAVDRETGEEHWSRSVGEGRYPDIVADPVIVGNDLVTSGYFRPLVAIDLPTRNIRWRLDVGGANAVTVGEIDGATVLFHPGTDGKLRAVSGLTGAELWAWDSKTTGALTTPVSTEAGLLVGSSEGGLYLIDPSTGQEQWRWHERWRLDGVSATPVVDGRQVLFVTNAGLLYSMVVPSEGVDRDNWGLRLSGTGSR